MMRKSFIAVVVLSLVGLLPAASSAAPVKAAVKIGAKCTKSGATAKVGSTNVICKRNSKKVLVWTKVVESAACKAGKEQLAKAESTLVTLLRDAPRQLADVKAQLEGLSGPDVDVLKKRIADMEASLPETEKAVKQLRVAVQLVCSLG